MLIKFYTNSAAEVMNHEGVLKYSITSDTNSGFSINDRFLLIFVIVFIVSTLTCLADSSHNLEVIIN